MSEQAADVARFAERRNHERQLVVLACLQAATGKTPFASAPSDLHVGLKAAETICSLVYISNVDLDIVDEVPLYLSFSRTNQ